MPIGVGEGMNSRVFRARDPQLSGEFAVKEIAKATFGNTPLDYFREAQTMFEVEHPNIVRIQYACQTPDQICLAMPFYPAGSVLGRIRKSPLALKLALQVVDDVLKGLSRIHMKGFLHLDIKPSNVLFSNLGTAMLADFGQARRVTGNGVVVVPAMYRWALPPETMQSGVATVESDIYQLGLLLYRILNADELYQSQKPTEQQREFQVIRGRFPQRERFMPHVPKRLRSITRKALKVEPSSRYRSANEMADELARVKLPLDWTMEILEHDNCRWTASRESKCDLEVELVAEGGTCEVSCWTVSGTERRAKRQLCANRLTAGEAEKYLTEVFFELA
jgi:serine/threonine protein kinase